MPGWLSAMSERSELPCTIGQSSFPVAQARFFVASNREAAATGKLQNKI